MTPNPDILCNKYIKFPMLIKYCLENIENVDYIATGHYSRLKFDSNIKSIHFYKSLFYLIKYLILKFNKRISTFKSS